MGKNTAEEEIVLRYVFFDLDGTLLPMDQEVFTGAYFALLVHKMAPLGYKPKELTQAVWQGTAAMVKNDGKRPNEEVFWDSFCGRFGPESRMHLPLFEDFYREDFQQVQQACGFQPLAVKAVELLHQRGYGTVLATNPIFPRIATQSRVRWAGLSWEDFLLCTTYENIGYCKPNPEYYREICRMLKIDPKECLMVGNDVGEDMIARQLGMQVYLVTDCLINGAGEDISQYPHGSFEEFYEFLSENLGEL